MGAYGPGATRVTERVVGVGVGPVLIAPADPARVFLGFYRTNSFGALEISTRGDVLAGEGIPLDPGGRYECYWPRYGDLVFLEWFGVNGSGVNDLVVHEARLLP